MAAPRANQLVTVRLADMTSQVFKLRCWMQQLSRLEALLATLQASRLRAGHGSWKLKTLTKMLNLPILMALNVLIDKHQGAQASI